MAVDGTKGIAMNATTAISSPRTDIRKPNYVKSPEQVTISQQEQETEVGQPQDPKVQESNQPPPQHSAPQSQQEQQTRRPVAAANGGNGEAGDTIGEYVLGETIGKGTFGKVKIGLHLLTGEKVAIKILEKKRIVQIADVERVAREIKILKRNRHVNVIQLYEVIDSLERIFLIMEHVDGGEMFEYIVAHHRIREQEAVVFFQQIVDGLSYLHANEVTHRDLKPENLLLQSHTNGGYSVKIVDFGLSNIHEGGRLLRTACGSPCYAAPEMIEGKLYKGPAADIWSLGVVLFAMVCGYLPFEDSNTSMLYKKILSADYKLPPFLSHNAQDLIRKILETNPEKRYTVEMIREHPWFTSVAPPIPKHVMERENTMMKEMIFNQLETLGFAQADVVLALQKNAHNRLTASYYLLYGKLVRILKERSTSTRPVVTPRERRRSEGTEKVHTTRSINPATSIQSPHNKAPVAGVESTCTNASYESSSTPRRHTTHLHHQHYPQPHSHSSHHPQHGDRHPHRAMTPAATSSARPSHLDSQSAATTRRPTSVRGGRNLVVSSATTTPSGPGTLVVTHPAAPNRPADRKIQPSTASINITGPAATRISISNGMVALAPLAYPAKRDQNISGAPPLASTQSGVRRHTMEVAHHSSPRHNAAIVVTNSSPASKCIATPTISNSSGLMARRRPTISTATLVSSSVAQTHHHPLAQPPSSSVVSKEDDVRPPQTSVYRMSPQVTHPHPPTTKPPSQFAVILQ